jgi:hypothetical protein
LQAEIIPHCTIAIPGKRWQLHCTEARRVWGLDRHEFDRQRYSPLHAIRIYLLHNGLSAESDLELI